jgi:hypothetical protein
MAMAPTFMRAYLKLKPEAYAAAPNLSSDIDANLGSEQGCLLREHL